MSQRELEIKVDSFRRIPNPYKDGPNSISDVCSSDLPKQHFPDVHRDL